jgi:hypothetical protein
MIANSELVYAPFDPKRFLSQFAIKEEASPELVWNDETRSELFMALQVQLKSNGGAFYEQLIEFEYSVNKRELRVENIFVRHFNNQTQTDFKPNDMVTFS